MIDSTVSRWFTNWLSYHQKLHPDRKWINPDDPDAYEHYEGWIEAFDQVGATEDLARLASKRLQARKFYFNEHLAKLIEIIGDLKRTQPVGPSVVSAPDPELLEASLKSANCPHCQGSGWETRRFLWHSFSRPVKVQVACSCLAGRWRKNHGEDPDPDPELAGLWRYLDPEESAPESMLPNEIARRMAIKANTSKSPAKKK